MNRKISNLEGVPSNRLLTPSHNSLRVIILSISQQHYRGQVVLILSVLQNAQSTIQPQLNFSAGTR